MKHKTRRQRQAGEALKKAGIWVFILVFVSSVVGVAIVTVVR